MESKQEKKGELNSVGFVCRCCSFVLFFVFFGERCFGNKLRTPKYSQMIILRS